MQFKDKNEDATTQQNSECYISRKNSIHNF